MGDGAHNSVVTDINTTYQRETQLSSWTDTYVNLHQLCRVCATHNDYLIPIFDGEGLQHRLETKIRIHLPIQVMRDDIFPVQLCYSCASTLMSWHALLNNCREADHKFRSLLGLKASTQLGHESELVLSTTPHVPSELDLTSATHSIPSAGSSQLDLTAVPHTVPSSDTSIERNSISEPIAVMQSGSMHHYAIPQTERVLDSILTQNMSAGLEMSVSTNIMSDVPPVITGDVTSHPVQQPVLVVDAGTQTEQFLQISQGEVPECALLIARKGALSKNTSKIRLVVVKKGKKTKAQNQNSSQFDQLQSGLSFLKNHEDQLNLITSSRVSTIQSTNTTYNGPQEGTFGGRGFNGAPGDLATSRNCRSKSVLVRNDAVPIKPNKSQSQSQMPSSTSGRAITTSAHQPGYFSEEASSGNVISVVRPTCLRRAPTKFEADRRENEELIDDPEAIFEAQPPKMYYQTGENYSNNQGGYEESKTRTVRCRILNNDIPVKGCEICVIVGSPPGCDSSPDSPHDVGTVVDRSRSCFHCSKIINNIVLLHAHERSHLSEPLPPTSFLCKFCGQSFGSFSTMQAHHAQHEAGTERQHKCQSSRKAFLCKQCGQMFTTEERLLLHQRTHTDNMESRFHECKTCGQSFQTRSKLSVHLWSHAMKPSHKTFKCHICGKGFMTKSAVLEHRLKHTEQERSCAFKCVICGMAFGNNSQLGKHRATHSEEERARPYKCSFCGKAFARNYTLQIHHLTHSEEKSHLCSQCGKGFKMRNSLMQHMRTHQDPSAWPSFPCHLCHKTFRVKSRLRDHLRLHTGDRPYECTSCGKRFHKVTSLHTHEVSHTERRPFMCDICGKSFKWSKNLRQHKLVHGNADGMAHDITTHRKRKKESKGQCDICGKQLSGKSSLRQHMANVHDGSVRKHSQPTDCPVCGKVLSSASGLARHLRITHGGVKAFKCDICDREYATKVARDDHRRSHTGERPFSCSVCPKTFTSLSNLHIHRTSHSDERPHKCSYCDKQFKRRAHLILHTRTHTGEKPYVCSICTRGFAQSNDLHKHRLTHSNDKAYACHCGMAFRLKRDLTRHQYKHHPALVLPPVPHILHSTPVISADAHIKQQSLPSLPSQTVVDMDPSELCASIPVTRAGQPKYVSSVLVRNSDFLLSMPE